MLMLRQMPVKISQDNLVAEKRRNAGMVGDLIKFFEYFLEKSVIQYYFVRSNRGKVLFWFNGPL